MFRSGRKSYHFAAKKGGGGMRRARARSTPCEENKGRNLAN